ncbi:Nematode resistance protein-like HSPRO2 [Acorus calamus]|uniref:Nematode resistance protein-like HSPRO2 n=1 Tax=Acorus calamus TaxID=4465 RepID=A0AAV9DDA1_ACOCL|nr:Nematode resistance protein-like HSPRO2 [Acorus calamus]
MVDLYRKTKMMSPEISLAKISNTYHNAIPSPTRLADRSSSLSSAALAYEQYLRLPELASLWTARDFPDWDSEPLLKPALQALEITFRFISVALSDPRPYADRREWSRRLESLACRQVELIAAVSEAEERGGGAPVSDMSSSSRIIPRVGSSLSREVWKLPGSAEAVVNRTSESSLLPRLAAWDKSEGIATKIQLEIECQMRRSPFTLGLGEPNLSGKPNLEYDRVCRPSELHALKRGPFDSRRLRNRESESLFTAQQILESWIRVANRILARIGERIDGGDWESAAGDCWLLERTWKLLSEIEDLLLLTDPDDFLRLKNQLAIRTESEALCFRSTALIEITRSSKDLRMKVPAILGVEVDPKGGPRVQEAAMKLFHHEIDGGDDGKIHLLQAMMAVEAAVKRFFFGYGQLTVAVMGSVEARGNRVIGSEGSDPLIRLFMEPAYFPSLDAAKTFLGDFWRREDGRL